jgi:hypothetical protein
VLAKNYYFGFPENGTLVLKRVGILYVVYDFEAFYVHSLLTALTARTTLTALTCKKDALSI